MNNNSRWLVTEQILIPANRTMEFIRKGYPFITLPIHEILPEKQAIIDQFIDMVGPSLIHAPITAPEPAQKKKSHNKARAELVPGAKAMKGGDKYHKWYLATQHCHICGEFYAPFAALWSTPRICAFCAEDIELVSEKIQ